ncbi:MAG: PTS glucose transporter subunit IIA, partial [Oscillospiraceae bacterium]|nr:PTS glucose transporter subunit IIA [Oscillospiraceae bacterium]
TLRLLDTKLGIESAVVIVGHIKGDDPIEMVRGIYDKYKVGRDDRGLVIVVGYLDHSYFIAPGHNLEADLTDTETHQLAKAYLIPSMKAEQPDSGMLYLARGIYAHMTQKDMPRMTALSASNNSDDGTGNMILNPAIKEFFHVGGYSVTNLGYQGHVIPVIIAILFMCWIEKKLHKAVPEMLDLFVTPLVTVLVTGLLTIAVIGPVFSTVEGWILAAAKALIGLPFGIGGLLVGFLYAFTVVAGFHHMYNMIEAQMLGAGGLNTWMPVATAVNVAQGAAAMAVSFKSKNPKTKSVAMPSSLSAFLGITEPAIFGVNVRYRTPFIAGCIGGGLGGMVATLSGVGATAYGVTGLFGFLITPGFTLSYALILLVSFVAAFAISFILYKDPAEELERLQKKEEKTTSAVGETVTAGAAAAAGTAAASAAGSSAETGAASDTDSGAEASGEPKIIYAPAKGKAIPSSEIQDPTFAAEVLGSGIGIIPEDGKIYAPFDSSLDLLYDTKHALGLTSKDDVEVLIHVGIDTVQLEGKYFTAHANSGDEVKKGQLLLEVDLAGIQAAGYKIDTPIIVTNTDDYAEVKGIKTGPVEPGEPVIEVR